MSPAPSRSLVLALAVVLLTAGLAGCIGTSSGEEFGSFADAREQAHVIVEPEEETDLRLGLIEPTSDSGVAQGNQNVTVLLWDDDSGEPVEDASFTLDAFMPMMGHGTEPEEDPEHVRYGVYRGSTNLMMSGEWLVYLNATLASGEQAHFEVPLEVAGDDGHGDMGHGHGGHEMASGYDSYEDARDAEGEVFEPGAESPIRLKLLDPHPREGVEQGETNVTVLLFDEEADEPVTQGNASLEARMPAMGHGTSPEKDPMHTEHGVWKGMTTLTMNGTWILNVDLDREDANTVSWAINVTVGDGGMDHDMGDEPAFEPYEEVFEDTVSSPEYDVNHTLPVKAANATLTMNGTLSATSPVAEITVELYDPDGAKLGSFTLTSDTNESSLTVEDAPAQGDHTVRVSGMALDASYRVAVHVAPP